MRPLVIFLCLAALLIPSGASADDVVLTVTVDNPSVSPAGGGSGGAGWLLGGGARFVGLAYPQSRVTLLQDGQAAVSALASADGSFQLAVTGLPAGTHIFSLFAEDAEGGFSSLFSVPLKITANAITTVTGIFLSPTLRLSLGTGEAGADKVIISGQSAPRAWITVRITPEAALTMNFTTLADANGRYSYLLNSRRLAPTVSSGLSAGDYLVQSRASLPGLLGPLFSDWSKVVRFRIGKDGVIELLPALCPPVADLNQDCRVNLVDFSIMVYWFKNPNPPAAVDLNRDGAVDLTDLSIATYYWTG